MAAISTPYSAVAIVGLKNAAVAEAGDHYRELMTFVRENGLEINGFSREIALIDNTVSSDDSRFVTQIAVPVK